jgi:hypothetical protein
MRKYLLALPGLRLAKDRLRHLFGRMIAALERLAFLLCFVVHRAIQEQVSRPRTLRCHSGTYAFPSRGDGAKYPLEPCSRRQHRRRTRQLSLKEWDP